LVTLSVNEKMAAFIEENVFLPTCELQTIIGTTQLTDNGNDILKAVLGKGLGKHPELALSPITENGLRFLYVTFCFQSLMFTFTNR